MIREFYKDKTIFLTGATGFVGKVILEKFLRSLPDVKRIYILVRPKRGVQIMDRVMKEIFQSPCFEKTRELPHFLQMIKDKIYPIQGDICKDNLQLSDADRQMLIKDLDIIINCAASVDFNEQISDAININYLGCLRMLDFA